VPSAVVVVPLAPDPSWPGTVTVRGVIVFVRGVRTKSKKFSVEVVGVTVLTTGVTIGQGLVMGTASA